MFDLKGTWQIEYIGKTGETFHGSLNLPGTMQAAGFGEPVTFETEFVSALHDPDWFLREEYASDDKDPLVPFLSKPRRHFVGIVSYSRKLDITPEINEDEYFLFLECVRRKSTLYIDGKLVGSSESYCAPHIIPMGHLQGGVHDLRIDVDNTLYPGFRPDAHTVTDSVGASWNGIVGEMAIISKEELNARYEGFKAYALAHPTHIETVDGNFVVNGRPEYIRGTHFGGDFPLTGHPSFEKEYYIDIFTRLKEWGFNLVRCHSCCPVEAMFAAADECGIYILAECGMWSTFGEGFPILDLLYKETESILREFGHHPSFVMLSPSNEPAGNWYKVLREWVSFARETDLKLGYHGRRLYTAQSGWFYDTSPASTVGTDFLYFHRSAYGPLKGGTVRNPAGWNGRDYSPSLRDVKLPVICHELGQWCAYPDFLVSDKFTGFLKPSNYKAFENLARKTGLYAFNKDMHIASGRNQMRLLKEEFEANHRTDELKGYEYLDVHDYPGQGTALVGIFDAFWDPKAYADKSYFKQFNGPDVLTAAFESYTVLQGSTVKVPVKLSYYSGSLDNRFKLRVELWDGDNSLYSDVYWLDTPAVGSKTELGEIELKIPELRETRRLTFKLTLDSDYSNSWELFAIKPLEPVSDGFKECLRFKEALDMLDRGEKVLFLPKLSELSYDCTPINERSVYWNAQMGPKWDRCVGVVCDTDSRFFDLFPSDMSGGFQFGSIFRSGRAIKIPGGFKPLIRAIDDWNRSIPEAFLLEAKVSNGSLLMAAFDRNAFDSPENKLFYAALTRYISSEEFAPEAELSMNELMEMFFPVNRMKALVSSVRCLSGECGNPEAMVLSNPNMVTLLKGVEPVLEVELKAPVRVEGFVWLNNQRSRMRDDQAKVVSITFGDSTAYTFELKNTVLEQRVLLPDAITTDKIIIKVLETWGRDVKPVYEERPDGFYKAYKDKEPKVAIAVFHLITDVNAEGDNDRFWENNNEVLTKEIDV